MAQETYDRAMDKLRDEMDASKGAVHMAGEIITLFLMADTENAEKILQEGKTIKGAYTKMRDLAKQKRRECFDADQAAEIFAEYYGFEKQSINDLWEAAQERRNAKPQAPSDLRTSGLRPSAHCGDEAGVPLPHGRGPSLPSVASEGILDDLDLDALLGL